MTVAELVGGEERAIRPAECDPRDGRLRLKLRQEHKLALVSLSGVEHVLQEECADSSVAARASSTIARTSLRTAATICSSMVLASSRLIDSAVRHHNRLDAAAVSRIAVNTNDETTRRMLIVSFPADEAGRRPAKAPRRGTALISISAGDEEVLMSIRRSPPFCYRASSRADRDHPCAAPQSTMPIRLGFNSDRAMDRRGALCPHGRPRTPKGLNNRDLTVLTASVR